MNEIVKLYKDHPVRIVERARSAPWSDPIAAGFATSPLASPQKINRRTLKKPQKTAIFSSFRLY